MCNESLEVMVVELLEDISSSWWFNPEESRQVIRVITHAALNVDSCADSERVRAFRNSVGAILCGGEYPLASAWFANHGFTW